MKSAHWCKPGDIFNFLCRWHPMEKDKIYISTSPPSRQIKHFSLSKEKKIQFLQLFIHQLKTKSTSHCRNVKTSIVKKICSFSAIVLNKNQPYLFQIYLRIWLAKPFVCFDFASVWANSSPIPLWSAVLFRSYYTWDHLVFFNQTDFFLFDIRIAASFYFCCLRFDVASILLCLLSRRICASTKRTHDGSGLYLLKEWWGRWYTIQYILCMYLWSELR